MNYIQFNKDTNEYNYSFPYHKLKKYRLENVKLNLKNIKG